MIEQGFPVYKAWNIAHKQLAIYKEWLTSVLIKLENFNSEKDGIETYDNLKKRQRFLEDKFWNLSDYCKSLSKQF